MSAASKTKQLSAGVVLLLRCGRVSAITQPILMTLTGVVTEASGSVIINANVVLKHKNPGDLRRSLTCSAANSDRYFSFLPVPAGGYSFEIEIPDFQISDSGAISK
jgi:hypothetical protein